MSGRRRGGRLPPDQARSAEGRGRDPSAPARSWPGLGGPVCRPMVRAGPAAALIRVTDGLEGHVGRVGQLGFVLAGWGLMLAWSAPWLARFRQGPLEWLWRSLTEWRVMGMRG